MKKTIFLFFVTFVFSGMLISQTITVTSPATGNSWCIGQTYPINWNPVGNMHAQVKIRLYQGITKILGITDSTPNDGSYSWPVPATVAPGTYIIRVKTIDNLVEDDSGNFTISDCEQNKPDLVIREMTVTARDQTYDRNSRPDCRAKIVNVGSGRSEATTTRLWVYLKRLLIVRPSQWVKPLEPGEHTTFGQLPQLPRPGKYRYILKVDPDNEISESDDNNNSDTKLYTLKPCELPDLTVELDVEKKMIFGQAPGKWARVVIKNTGLTSSGACRVDIWIGDRHLPTLSFPVIGAGQIIRKRLKKLPLISLGKPRRFKVIIDLWRLVNECDETNNKAERSYKF